MPRSKSLVDEAEKSFRSYYPNYKARSARGQEKREYMQEFVGRTCSFLKENYTNEDFTAAMKKAHRSLKP